MRTRCLWTRINVSSMMHFVCKQSRELLITAEDHKEETKIKEAIHQARASGVVEILKMTSSMGASRTKKISTTTIHSLTVARGLPLEKTLVSKDITTTRMAKISTGHPPNQDREASSKGSTNPISMKTPTTTILLAALRLIQSMEGISGSLKEDSERPIITRNGVERPTRKRQLRISVGGSMRSGLVCKENMERTTSQTSTRSRRTDIRSRLMRRDGQKEKLSLESTNLVPNLASTPRIGRTCG